jgi:hypothetical protein
MNDLVYLLGMGLIVCRALDLGIGRALNPGGIVRGEGKLPHLNMLVTAGRIR